MSHEIVIPTGGPRDGWIWASVNGNDQWIKAGVPTALEPGIAEVLGRAGIRYSTVLEGSFTDIATNNAADGVYTINGAPASMEQIIWTTNPDDTFDPVVDVDAGGISRSQFTLTSSVAATLLASGFTIVIEWFAGALDPENMPESGGPNPKIGFVLRNANYTKTTDAALSVVGNLSSTTSLTLDAGDTYVSWLDNPSWEDSQAGQVNRVAISFTSTYAAMSINGDVAHRVVGVAIDPAQTLIDFDIGPHDDTRLRSFAFYATVGDADLPGLSAL